MEKFMVYLDKEELMVLKNIIKDSIAHGIHNVNDLHVARDLSNAARALESLHNRYSLEGSKK